LSDIHLTNFDLVNIFESVFSAFAFVLTLNLKNPIIPGTLKKYIVLRIKLEIVTGTHRVEHVDLVLVVFEFFAFYVHIQRENKKAIL